MNSSAVETILLSISKPARVSSYNESLASAVLSSSNRILERFRYSPCDIFTPYLGFVADDPCREFAGDQDHLGCRYVVKYFSQRVHRLLHTGSQTQQIGKQIPQNRHHVYNMIIT